MPVPKLLLLLSCLFSASAFSQISFGEPHNIDADWKFTLQDKQEAKEAAFDDASWQNLDLPHDWSIKGQLSPTLASATGYLPGGIGWYRKSLDIPQSKSGQKVYLYFEGVYNRSEVYLNGHLLGKRPNGYISFAYDATPYVDFGGKNTVAVRVDHSKSADSRWYTGSGIYRDVWLIYANNIHITQWGVYAYPEVKKDSGILNVEVEVENGSQTNAKLTVVNELFSGQGKVVAASSQALNIANNQSGKISISLKVKNPELWDLGHPKLYRLKTTVFQNGKIVDTAENQTGFRTFTFDPDKGFALNGNWMKIKGVCIHHDAGVLGSAVPQSVMKARLEALKAIGVNAIRTSHNPQSPFFYALCDQLGLLVLNEAYDEWEFPKRKWLEGWNVGTPGFESNTDIFAEWAEKDLEDFVRRDRNHLSVFAWSIGNEVDYPNDPYSHPVLDGDKASGFSQPTYGGYKKDAPDAMRLGAISKRLVAAVKKYDKSRPVTAGLAGVAMSNETEYPGNLDITGYNYTESKYGSDHQKYPERVIFGSENSHDISAWLAVQNNAHIFGQFLWTGIDYLGESHKWPSRGHNAGLIDFAGQIKSIGYFRQSLWSNKPMIYIGTYIPGKEDKLSKEALPLWNYSDGQIVRIVCYTNAAKARLELNGHVIGQKDYDPTVGIISWDIPFSKGKLEVIGLDSQNKEVSRNVIVSSKRPFALVLKENTMTLKDQHDIAQLRIDIVDEDGLPVLLSDNEITCTISGSAKLLGLEGGNNADMTDYTDNKQRVYNGHLLAYIQATGSGIPITVTFTSPWLEPVQAVIKL